MKNYRQFGSRRRFLRSATMVASSSIMIGGVPMMDLMTNKKGTTARELIQIIIRDIPNAPFEKTVDQLITGNPDQDVTGIVTTMFPTIEVIKSTASLGANFIIAHETPFYNHQDETDWLKEDDAYRYKAALIEKHQIAIWRFHDYWHRHEPDGIIMGNLIKLGWKEYYDPENPRLLKLPEGMTTRAIGDHIKDKFGIDSIRAVGPLDQVCNTIYLAFGYMGSTMQIGAIQEHKPDLILSGETREWETVERVRDGIIMDQKTSLLVLGHSVSEEAGMEYAADWLRPQIPDIKVTHVPAQNPFSYF